MERRLPEAQMNCNAEGKLHSESEKNCQCFIDAYVIVETE